VIPLAGYQTLLAGVQGGYLPRGKSLKELMGIALGQFEQDKQEFAQEQRATGEAGEVSYAYTDPFFEETDIEEEEEAPAAAPMSPLMGFKAPPNFMNLTKSPKAPSEFETWMATKYGGQSA
jgi:hypothetical protein